MCQIATGEFKHGLVDESIPEHQDTSSSSHDLPLEPRAKVVSGKHSIFTRFPKDRNCERCLRTKITRASCRKRTGAVVPRADNLGDLITADHKVLSEGYESRNNHRYAVVVQDLATQWLQFYSCKTKTYQRPRRACRSSWSLRGNQKSFTLTILWNLASPSRNYPGIIVRQHHTDQKLIGLLREECAESWKGHLLCCCCLDEKWWADSIKCYCYLRNFQDLLSDGKTPYERRFRKPI